MQELQGKELADFLMKKSVSTWDDIVEERAGLNEIDNNFIEKFKKYAVERIPSIIQETDNAILRGYPGCCLGRDINDTTWW